MNKDNWAGVAIGILVCLVIVALVSLNVDLVGDGRQKQVCKQIAEFYSDIETQVHEYTCYVKLCGVWTRHDDIEMNLSVINSCPVLEKE